MDLGLGTLIMQIFTLLLLLIFLRLMLSAGCRILPPFSRYYLTDSFLYLELMSSEEITDLIINLQKKMAVVLVGGEVVERKKDCWVILT